MQMPPNRNNHARNRESATDLHWDAIQRNLLFISLMSGEIAKCYSSSLDVLDCLEAITDAAKRALEKNRAVLEEGYSQRHDDRIREYNMQIAAVIDGLSGYVHPEYIESLREKSVKISLACQARQAARRDDAS